MFRYREGEIYKFNTNKYISITYKDTLENFVYGLYVVMYQLIKILNT